MVRDPERPTGKIWVSYNAIDATIWKSLYGTKTVNGKLLSLCWYHCNRPRGCNSTTCSEDHSNFPTAYCGQHLMAQTQAFQHEVALKCKKIA